MLQRVGGKGEGPEAKAAAREAVVITESPLRMHTARTSGGDGALFSVSVPGEVRGVEMADRAFGRQQDGGPAEQRPGVLQ